MTMTLMGDAARFLAAVIILVYVPGRLTLDIGRAKVRQLDAVSLTLVLGTALSGLLYWVTVRARVPRLFTLWPLIAAAFYVAHRRGSWPSLRCRAIRLDASTAVLVGTLALGLVPLFALPYYFRNMNLRPDGTMQYHGLADAIFHLSIGRELTHSIPPDIPFFAGRRLSYHYGMDLACAMIARTAGLDVAQVTLWFMPALMVESAILAIYCFSRRCLDSPYAAALVSFLVFFGEDFSFVPGLLLRSHDDWSARFFSVPTTFSLYLMNPMLPALGVLFAGLFCLNEYCDGKGSWWLVLTVFLFSVLTLVKVFTGAQIFVVLGMAAVLSAVLDRDTRLLKAFAGTGVVMGVFGFFIWRANNAGAGVAIIPGHATFISEAVEHLGLGSTVVGRQTQAFFASGRVTGAISGLGLALPAYLLGSLGVRSIGIPATYRAIAARVKAPVGLVLAIFVVVGPLVTLTCDVTPVPVLHPYNNSVWFFVQSKYVAWIFAVDALRRFWSDRAGYWRATAIVAAVALAVPSTIQHFVKSAAERMEVVGRDDLEVIDYLRRTCSPADVVLAEGRVSALVVAMTNCRVPFLELGLHLVPATDSVQRSADLADFWRSWHQDQLRADVFREYSVRYLVTERRGPPIGKPRFANDAFRVLEVGDWPPLIRHQPGIE